MTLVVKLKLGYFLGDTILPHHTFEIVDSLILVKKKKHVLFYLYAWVYVCAPVPARALEGQRRTSDFLQLEL